MRLFPGTFKGDPHPVIDSETEGRPEREHDHPPCGEDLIPGLVQTQVGGTDSHPSSCKFGPTPVWPQIMKRPKYTHKGTNMERLIENTIFTASWRKHTKQ